MIFKDAWIIFIYEYKIDLKKCNTLYLYAIFKSTIYIKLAKLFNIKTLHK